VDPSAEYPLLGIRLDAQGPFHRETVVGTQTSATRLYEVRTGDFIYSRLFAWRGAFGLIRHELDGFFVSNEFPTFRANDDRLDLRFLFYWLRLPDVLRRVEADCTGSTPLTRNRYKEQFFLNLEIPLPSLDQQRRIVAKIDALAAKIDEARALQQQSSIINNSFWSAALNAAFKGELVPNNVATQSAQELLAYSAAAYATFIETKANNAHPHKPRMLAEGSYQLPVGWAWTTLGSVLTHLVDCVNDTPDFADSDTGYIGLKSTNIRPYLLDLRQKWFVSESDFRSWNRRETPLAGDIVLTREAPVGYACMVPKNIVCCLTQRLMLLRVASEVMLPDLLLHYLNSPVFLDQVIEHSRGLTTPHIRVQDAPNFLLPLPPMSHQRAIVSQLDKLQSKFRQMRGLGSETAKELDAMLPAILDKAFRGEL
jgi:type I restriction enzyme S subunit